MLSWGLPVVEDEEPDFYPPCLTSVGRRPKQLLLEAPHFPWTRLRVERPASLCEGVARAVGGGEGGERDHPAAGQLLLKQREAVHSGERNPASGKLQEGGSGHHGWLQRGP